MNMTRLLNEAAKTGQSISKLRMLEIMAGMPEEVRADGIYPPRAPNCECPRNFKLLEDVVEPDVIV
jgi:hypothetical protein